ncbi:hypothetical protein ONZ51_g9398 [Trametes cubensis]|uniref:Uncharacterized protein n=1 Tax=Trametes cubensis TaxID=1111947 RepID=A0AAD7TLE8_9APHY|nr:hypothetical protein ONZ51_g9398 [Trametes cubensis]
MQYKSPIKTYHEKLKEWETAYTAAIERRPRPIYYTQTGEEIKETQCQPQHRNTSQATSRSKREEHDSGDDDDGGEGNIPQEHQLRNADQGKVEASSSEPAPPRRSLRQETRKMAKLSLPDANSEDGQSGQAGRTRKGQSSKGVPRK